MAWAAALGHAVQVLSGSPRRTFRLASVYHFLMPPVRLGQIVFLFNSHGIATSYAAWAYLTDEVAREVTADPARLLAMEEWNEGTQLWVLDVVAPFGDVRSLLRAARCRVRGHERAWSRRSDRAGAPLHGHRLRSPGPAR